MVNLRDIFREYLKQYMGKGYRLNIKGNSIEIFLYRNGIVKMTRKIDKKQGGALGRLPDIINKIDYAYSSEVVDKQGQKKENIDLYDVFYTPLKIGENNNIGVKVVVEQYDRGNGQIHDLKTREADLGVAVRPFGDSTRGALQSTSSDNTIHPQSENVNNSNEKAKPYTGISGKLGEGSRDFNEGRTTKEVVQGKIKADEFIDKVFITVN